jgi:hypothetical protein
LDFRKAVRTTPHLENAWQPGLGALRAEDRAHIRPQDSRNLRGSADIDTAWQTVEPHANRWDFAIAYKHTNIAAEFVYWVETHTGSDDQIKTVLKKLEWLKRWLRGDGRKLAGFEKEFVWVASGATSFTSGSTQVKRLAEQGLRYAGSSGLNLRNEHPAPPRR